MRRLSQFLLKNFERVLVLGLALVIVFLNLFIARKLSFLNFYYLPILVSGYVLGRNYAILTALFCILLVAFVASVNPQFVASEQSTTNLALDLVVWGGFLILAAYVVGTLYAQKEKKIQELKHAYVGVIEILAKYIEANDRYTRGHSVRVADYATDIARALKLPSGEIENIRVAALLHNIGRMEISSDLIRKAAKLTVDDYDLVGTETGPGTDLLRQVGNVLEAALPITLRYHVSYLRSVKDIDLRSDQIPYAVQILYLADRFDELTTTSAYRQAVNEDRAFSELAKFVGVKYTPEVFEAFTHVYKANHKVLSEAVKEA